MGYSFSFWMRVINLWILLGGLAWPPGGHAQAPPDSLLAWEAQGDAALEARDWDLARGLYTQVAMSHDRPGGDSLGLARVRARLAYLHIQDFALDTAQHLLGQALRVQAAALPAGHPDLGRTYYYLGQAAFRAKDHALAQEYLEHTLRIRRANFGPDHPSLAPALEMLALCQWRSGDSPSACRTQAEAIRLLAPGSSPMRLSGSYLNLGMFQGDAQQPTAALASFEEALTLRQQATGPQHPSLGQIFQNLGYLLLTQGKPQAALPYFQRGYALSVQAFPPFHPIPARFATNQAMAYRALQQWREALEWHQRALGHLLPGLREAAIETPLPPGASPLAGELVEALREKGFTLLAKNEALPPVRAELELALAQFRQAAGFIDSVRLGFQAEASKLDYGERAREVYEGGISAAWHLYATDPQPAYLAEAFQFAERARALILLEAIQESGSRAAAGLSPALARREDSLRQALAGAQRARLAAENQGAGPARLDSLRATEFACRRAYQQVLDTLARAYPAYHRAAYGLSMLDPGTVQEQLPAGTAQLTYFLTADHLFVFVLEAADARWLRLDRPPGLTARIEALRAQLTPQAWATGSSAVYDSLAHLLYTELIAPLGPLPRHLRIIPDEVLAYLPFDALLTAWPAQPGAYRQYPYLARAHVISYAYSATWLQEVRRLPEATGTAPLLAVAPGHFAGRPPLPYSQAEAQYLHQQYRGQLLTGAQANRAHFLAAAAESPLIHLSTHAHLHDDVVALSAIFLEGSDSLTLQEIAALRLQAQLVVLSACETGAGKWLSGEGLQSLGRAFSLAGCKSLLTTLWQVNDETTLEIMQDFYAGLAQGLPKDAAIHQAKMAHLDRADHLLAHPYFWAGYTLWGDIQPVHPGRPRSWWPWALTGLLLVGGLLAGGWYYRRRA